VEEGPAQIGPVYLRQFYQISLHRGGQSAHYGFNFGQFGHSIAFLLRPVWGNYESARNADRPAWKLYCKNAMAKDASAALYSSCAAI